MGGKSRKSGGVSKKLINRIIAEKNRRSNEAGKQQARSDLLDRIARNLKLLPTSERGKDEEEK